MSENTKYSSFMSESEIKNLSVTALSNRPNERTGQYGKKGLTPEQLKAAFSALPTAIAERLNQVIPELVDREYFDGQVDGKVDKLTPDSNTFPYPYVYTVDKDGKHSLVRSTQGSEPNTIVLRDENGFFTVKAPTLAAHPVSKLYFDNKTNNSLYYDHTALERRVTNIEHGSNGKLYDTVELSGSGSALQVDNALPYGILSRISGNVKTITVGLPYTFEGGVIHTLEKEDGTKVQLYKYTTDGNALIIPKGSRYWVKFPSKIPEGATVTARADGLDVFNEFSFVEGKGTTDTTVSSGRAAFTGNGYVVLDSASEYFKIHSSKNGTPTATDIRVENLRILIDTEHLEGVTLYHTVTIVLPDSITSLAGYGEEGSYLDLTEGKFYRADGSSKDVSGDLPVECDVISLLPGSIVKFEGADGEPVTAEYSLSYKNRITT